MNINITFRNTSELKEFAKTLPENKPVIFNLDVSVDNSNFANQRLKIQELFGFNSKNDCSSAELSLRDRLLANSNDPDMWKADDLAFIAKIDEIVAQEAKAKEAAAVHNVSKEDGVADVCTEAEAHSLRKELEPGTILIFKLANRELFIVTRYHPAYILPGIDTPFNGYQTLFKGSLDDCRRFYTKTLYNRA